MRPRLGTQLCGPLAAALLGASLAAQALADPGTGAASAIDIAGGDWHTCALTELGGVLCWGRNSAGQLGDATHTNRSEPVPVSGLASDAAAIAIGNYHSCALTKSGSVRCWGANGYGQLGDGSTALSRNVPGAVSGLSSGVVAIAAGQYHTCALTGAGGVWCWGQNFTGQLGDGTTTHRNVPVPVAGLSSGIAAIATGGEHTCALAVAGEALCWGRNYSGQLGDGTTTNRLVPVAVSVPPGELAGIAAGQWHTCALTTTGGVLCWGGQLGNGSDSGSTTPVAVSNLSSGVVAIAAGGFHSCALTSDGNVRCWGRNNSGQLGDGSTANRNTPGSVRSLSSGTARIAAGREHSCALTTSGAAVCWGANYASQLGDGTASSRAQPRQVRGFANAVAIEAGTWHACARTADEAALCWGANSAGQLGNGTTIDSGTPGYVAGLSSSVMEIAAGAYHTCAVRSAGSALCWGENSSGQLGDGTTAAHITPAGVVNLSGVAALGVGNFHTCALTTGGGVVCWGGGWSGQLGNGGTIDRAEPVPVSGLASGVATISAGALHVCALTSADGAMCWGDNYDGRLGNGGDGGLDAEPSAVSGLSSGVAAISAGGKHTCSVTSGGAALCWGDNEFGQLGNGGSSDSSVPIAVSDLPSGVAAIAAGYDHTCALTTGGGVLCWGSNAFGQLGIEGPSSSPVPLPVPNLSSGVAAISVGLFFSCALTTDGEALCWGNNERGQLGDGHGAITPEPVGVVPEPPFSLGLLTALASLGLLERRRRPSREDRHLLVMPRP